MAINLHPGKRACKLLGCLGQSTSLGLATWPSLVRNYVGDSQENDEDVMGGRSKSGGSDLGRGYVHLVVKVLLSELRTPSTAYNDPPYTRCPKNCLMFHSFRLSSSSP